MLAYSQIVAIVKPDAKKRIDIWHLKKKINFSDVVPAAV